jgi:epoxyqueuosine reductase
MSSMNEIRFALATIGVGLWGVADGAPWAELLPGCRSVIVFGNGGVGLWDSMVAAIRAEPSRLTASDHPLDDHVRCTIEAADPRPEGRRWVRCAADETTLVDFRTLALEAGLGWPSRLGLLIDDEHGPWMALRAACFTTEQLAPTPRFGDGPCEGCPAPCVDACPGEALPGGRWDPSACAGFHFTSELCRGTCAARIACPVGAPHAYGALQLRYHSWREAGRAGLADELGIDDPGAAPDLAWASWADKGP